MLNGNSPGSRNLESVHHLVIMVNSGHSVNEMKFTGSRSMANVLELQLESFVHADGVLNKM